MQGDLGINMESTQDGVQVLNSDGVSAGYDIMLPSDIPGTNESDGATTNKTIVEQVTIPSGQEDASDHTLFLVCRSRTFRK